jgi:hypothetical protein
VLAACRKLDDIPGDQFIELAGPTDQSESVAHVLVRDGHGLDRFRPKSLTSREWNGVQKWSCRHAVAPQAAISGQRSWEFFVEILRFYCEGAGPLTYFTSGVVVLFIGCCRAAIDQPASSRTPLNSAPQVCLPTGYHGAGTFLAVLKAGGPLGAAANDGPLVCTGH